MTEDEEIGSEAALRRLWANATERAWFPADEADRCRWQAIADEAWRQLTALTMPNDRVDAPVAGSPK